MGQKRFGKLLGILAALLLTLTGIGLLGPDMVRAKNVVPCPSEQDLQRVMTNGGTLANAGATPCSIDLTSHLVVHGGVSITIDGGTGGLTLYGTNLTDMINAHQLSSGHSLRLHRVTLIGGKLDDVIFGGADHTGGAITLDDSSIITSNDQKSWGIDVVGMGPRLQVIDSTIVAYFAINAYYAEGGSVTIRDSTLKSNYDGGYVMDTKRATEPITITASILATANDTQQSCSGHITDGGFNLATDSTCDFSSDSTSKVVTTDDLKLADGGIPGNYGGPTESIALAAGSAALDRIPKNTTVTVGSQSTTLCSSTADSSTTDQRGVHRPQGARCDIGAFERTTALTVLTCSADPAQPDYTNPKMNESWYGGNVSLSCPLIDDAADTPIYVTVQAVTSAPPSQVTASASLGTPTCIGPTCNELRLNQDSICLGTDCIDSPATTFNIDRQDPTISTPANGETFSLGTMHTASYSCQDDDGSGVASCSASASGTRLTKGAKLDTNTAGPHSFTVTSIDNVGNTGNKVVTYNVVATPVISWSPAPTILTYGGKLDQGQLDATATDPQTNKKVDGTFTYTYPDSDNQPVPVANATVLPAGTYQITANFTPDDGADYKSASSNLVTFTVKPAKLTITAPSLTRIYGGVALQDISAVSYASFANNEGSGVLGGKLSCGLTDSASHTVALSSTLPTGTYTITCSGQTSDNYAITYTPGSLTVTYGTEITNGPIVVRRGYYAVIGMKLVDTSGHNLSRRALRVTAENIVPVSQPWSGKDDNFVYAFRYGSGGYRLILNTRSLQAGSYVLSYEVAGDPMIHTMAVEIR